MNTKDSRDANSADSGTKDVKFSLLFFLVIVLIVVSGFNFYTDRSSKVVTEADVQKAVATYLTENSEVLAKDYIVAAAKQVIQDERDTLLKSISNAATTEEIEKTVDGYIFNKTDRLLQAVNDYQRKQFEEQQKKQTEAVGKRWDEIKARKDLPSAGSSSAKYTIVEFFDYSCGYCKRAYPVVKQIIEEHSDVRMLFMEFPILSEQSANAAKYAMAVFQIAPNKYYDFHGRLMEHQGAYDDAALDDAVSAIGLDAKEVAKKAKDPAVEQEINKHRELARDLGISGTPAFLVNGELVPGFASYEDMVKMLGKDG